MPIAEGGCHCGDVRYRVECEPVHTSLCHCNDCRRATGAPAVAWAMYPQTALKITHGTPRKHVSSMGIERSFCGNCGTALFYLSDQLPGLVDITICSFDKPESCPPSVHIWNRYRLTWFQDINKLPAFNELPPREMGDGNGET